MSGAVAGAAARPHAQTNWRRLGIMAGVGLGALVAAAYGANYLVNGQYLESTDDAYVGANVSSLAPQVSGLVTQIDVSDNQAVHAGQLLVQLDDRPYRAAVAKAEADTAGARAALANLNATETLQQAVIAEAQADIITATAAAALGKENAVRYKALSTTNAGSVQNAQTAQSTYQQDLAALQKAHAALTAQTAQLAVIATEKTQALATLAADLAAQDAAQLNERYTQIRAPFDGVIGNRAAHVGDYAAAGSQLLSLVPLHGLWIDANFKEDQLAKLQPGQPVQIVADIAPGVNITGHVISVAPASGAVFSILPAENATGNFTKIVQRVPVRIALDGNVATLGLLRPGLSVTATVNTK